VPAYDKSVREMFDRCLDQYLCPRTRKKRVNFYVYFGFCDLYVLWSLNHVFAQAQFKIIFVPDEKLMFRSVIF
jgi:BOP1NT (NUC169) domain